MTTSAFLLGFTNEGCFPPPLAVLPYASARRTTSGSNGTGDNCFDEHDGYNQQKQPAVLLALLDARWILGGASLFAYFVESY